MIRRVKEKKIIRKAAFYAKEFPKENSEVPAKFRDQILVGDSEDILKEFPDNCIDLILTSPPYNFGRSYDSFEDVVSWPDYFEKLFKILNECIRVLKYGGRLVINVRPCFSDYIPTNHIISNYFMEQGLIWMEEIIWEKYHHLARRESWGSWKSPSCPHLHYTWEYLLVYAKGSVKHEGKKELIDITREEFLDWNRAYWEIIPETQMNKYGHPAMFPVELAKRVLKLYSYIGDVVLDPFNGAGTTTFVAKLLKRHYIGIDISEKYCEIAKARLKSILDFD